MGMALKNIYLMFFIITINTLSSSFVFANTCGTNKVEEHCLSVTVLNTNGTAVPEIVIYLLPLEGQTLSEQSESITIAQKDKAFSPYISVSQRNQSVKFINQDDITHHIYSVDADNKFAFKIKSGESHTLPSLQHSAEVAMGCNIHDWMSGYMLIVDTPYFAKTDPQGQATFAVKEPGRYQITVWHPQLDVTQHKVTLQQVINNKSDVTITLPKDLSKLPIQQSSEDFDFLSGY